MVLRVMRIMRVYEGFEGRYLTSLCIDYWFRTLNGWRTLNMTYILRIPWICLGAFFSGGPCHYTLFITFLKEAAKLENLALSETVRHLYLAAFRIQSKNPKVPSIVISHRHAATGWPELRFGAIHQFMAQLSSPLSRIHLWWPQWMLWTWGFYIGIFDLRI